MNNYYMEYDTCIHDYLIKSAERHPKKDALIFDETHVSYAELNSKSTKLSLKLKQLGLRREDRIIIFLDNSIESVISLYGILKAGCVFVIVNNSIKASQLAYYLDDTGAKVIITHREKQKTVKEAIQIVESSVNVIWIGGFPQFPERFHHVDSYEWEACICQGEPDSGNVLKNFDCDRLAGLVYTSGSTGKPKGVMSSHRNVTSAAQSIISFLGNNQNDIILNVFPLSFDYGLYQIFMGVIFGGTVVLEQNFMFPHKTLQLIKSKNITGFPISPTLASIILKLDDLSKYDFTSLRYITSTGDIFHVDQIKNLQALVPNANVYSMFGLTECKRVSYLDPKQLANRPLSVGKAMPSCSVRIVDKNGCNVISGEIGELVVEGSNVMQGYWNDQELTKKYFRTGKVINERILYSGDYFWQDEEDYLYYVGRKDDIIKIKENRISVKEIETTIGKIAGVLNTAVVGIISDTGDKILRAYVIIDEFHKLTPNDIYGYCSRHLEVFKIPNEILFVDKLPLTLHGKINREFLKNSR